MNKTIHFPLDEGKGNICKDASGSLKGTLKGQKLPRWVDGRYGKALEFESGALSYLEIDLVCDTPTITAMAWVKTENSGPWVDIITCKDDNDKNRFRVFIIPREIAVEVQDPPKEYRVTNSGTALTKDFLGTWFHVAATFDGLHLRLYLNGELVGDDILPEPMKASKETTKIIIGNWEGTGVKYALDDFKVFNFVVQPDDIIKYIGR